jgi:hypothetical protein
MHIAYFVFVNSNQLEYQYIKHEIYDKTEFRNQNTENRERNVQL